MNKISNQQSSIDNPKIIYFPTQNDALAGVRPGVPIILEVLHNFRDGSLLVIKMGKKHQPDRERGIGQLLRPNHRTVPYTDTAWQLCEDYITLHKELERAYKSLPGKCKRIKSLNR